MKTDPRVLLRQLGERIDALSLRERAILFVTLLVVLYFAASALLFAPFRAESARLEKELGTQRSQLSALNTQIRKVVDAATRDPDVDNAARVKQLTEKIGVVDPRLAQVTQSLVTPRDMVRFVEQVLTRNRTVQVLRIENQPPTLVEGGGDKGVYKHGMRIEVRGRYVDLVNYLRALEGMPWRVFWGQATLVSDPQTTPQLTLVIYTLSLKDSWIGI
jgi:MSHA biogenesis protein MshJ